MVDRALRFAGRAGVIRRGTSIAELGVVSRVLMLSLDNLGDAIFGTPAVEALKKILPAVRLTVLCRPSSAAVFESNPYVDEVMTDEAPWWSAAPLRGSLTPRYWRHYLSTVSRLRREHYDVIVDLRGDLRHLLLFGLFARPKILLGHDRTGGGVLLAVRPPYETDASEVDKKLALLLPLGVKELRPAPRIWARPEEIDSARRLITARGVGSPIVVIDPGAKRVQQWPVEHFAHVARRLRDKTGTPVLVSAGPTHQHLARQLADMAGDEAVRLVGDLTVRGLMALVAAAHLVISADTGIAHIAAAVGSPTVTLFGPTEPRRFWHASHPSECVRCDTTCCLSDLHDACRFSRSGQPGICMLGIEPDDVVAAALRVLAARESGSKRDEARVEALP